MYRLAPVLLTTLACLGCNASLMAAQITAPLRISAIGRIDNVHVEVAPSDPADPTLAYEVYLAGDSTVTPDNYQDLFMGRALTDNSTGAFDFVDLPPDTGFHIVALARLPNGRRSETTPRIEIRTLPVHMPPRTAPSWEAAGEGPTDELGSSVATVDIDPGDAMLEVLVGALSSRTARPRSTLRARGVCIGGT